MCGWSWESNDGKHLNRARSTCEPETRTRGERTMTKIGGNSHMKSHKFTTEPHMFKNIFTINACVYLLRPIQNMHADAHTHTYRGGRARARTLATFIRNIQIKIWWTTAEWDSRMKKRKKILYVWKKKYTLAQCTCAMMYRWQTAGRRRGDFYSSSRSSSFFSILYFFGRGSAFINFWVCSIFQWTLLTVSCQVIRVVDATVVVHAYKSVSSVPHRRTTRSIMCRREPCAYFILKLCVAESSVIFTTLDTFSIGPNVSHFPTAPNSFGSGRHIHIVCVQIDLWNEGMRNSKAKINDQNVRLLSLLEIAFLI